MSLNQIPQKIIDSLDNCLGRLVSFNSVSGGCINNGGKIVTQSGNYFIKWNSTIKYPVMFNAEKSGLELLGIKDGVRIPKVELVGQTPEYSFIVMEYLEPSIRVKDYWQKFGQGLAVIHQKSSQGHGLNHDNYIGSLPQSNHFQKSWPAFFVNQRLLFQLKLAVEGSRISGGEANQMESSFAKLEKEIPDRKPSLLHGDLWSGNLITGPEGEPCLIDPAVYYGHPEMDLAMSQLFGGIDHKYLEAYNEVLPLEPGYMDRFDIWNLYPLMVHVNLFGGGYLSQVKQILRKYQ